MTQWEELKKWFSDKFDAKYHPATTTCSEYYSNDSLNWKIRFSDHYPTSRTNDLSITKFYKTLSDDEGGNEMFGIITKKSAMPILCDIKRAKTFIEDYILVCELEHNQEQFRQQLSGTVTPAATSSVAASSAAASNNTVTAVADAATNLSTDASHKNELGNFYKDADADTAVRNTPAGQEWMDKVYLPKYINNYDKFTKRHKQLVMRLYCKHSFGLIPSDILIKFINLYDFPNATANDLDYITTGIFGALGSYIKDNKKNIYTIIRDDGIFDPASRERIIHSASRIANDYYYNLITHNYIKRTIPLWNLTAKKMKKCAYILMKEFFDEKRNAQLIPFNITLNALKSINNNVTSTDAENVATLFMNYYKKNYVNIADIENVLDENKIDSIIISLNAGNNVTVVLSQEPVVISESENTAHENNVQSEEILNETKSVNYDFIETHERVSDENWPHMLVYLKGIYNIDCTIMSVKNGNAIRNRLFGNNVIIPVKDCIQCIKACGVLNNINSDIVISRIDAFVNIWKQLHNTDMSYQYVDISIFKNIEDNAIRFSPKIFTAFINNIDKTQMNNLFDIREFFATAA